MNRLSRIAVLVYGLLAANMAASAQPEAIGAPAVIPHPIADYLPITIEKNMCTTCHRPASGPTAKKGEIPQTHLVSGKLSGERYECTLCHAPSGAQSEIAPVDPNEAID